MKIIKSKENINHYKTDLIEWQSRYAIPQNMKWIIKEIVVDNVYLETWLYDTKLRIIEIPKITWDKTIKDGLELFTYKR